jgi:hypothetical protein
MDITGGQTALVERRNYAELYILIKYFKTVVSE